MVKDLDNFWKVWGLVDGFNESRRQISSGVVKTAGGPMSAIRFCNNPKVDLLHYSYIFRYPEPFGKWIKNVACSRLGTMLQLDIQKVKEAMNASKFQQEIGNTTACMNRIIMTINGCIQLASNGIYFDNSLFSGVKMAKEVMAEVVDYCGTVKTIHKGFVCLN